MKYRAKWELILGEKRFREKSPTISLDGRNPFEKFADNDDVNRLDFDFIEASILYFIGKNNS